MSSWKHLVVSGALLLALSVPVLAQDAASSAAAAPAPAPRAGQRGGARQPNLSALPIEALDSIVTLKADQKTKLTAIHDKLKEDTKAANSDRQKLGELRTQANTDIKAVLTPDQTKMLDDALPTLTMLNQSHAVPYAVLGKVKLTKDQMDKIQTIVTEEQEKLKGVARAERRAKRAEVDADFKTRVDPILTADQKDIIAKYAEKHPSAAPAPAPGSTK